MNRIQMDHQSRVGRAASGCGTVLSAVWLLALAGCGSPLAASRPPAAAVAPGEATTGNTTQGHQTGPHASTQADATGALPGTSSAWPSFGNNLWEDRFAPDTQLTPTSVAKLEKVYDFSLPASDGGNESYPVEQDGVLYVTTRNAEVLALRADTGVVVWDDKPPTTAAGLPHINRGVALGDGNVYVLTADDHLVAMRQADGKVVFNVSVANPADFQFESMAPQFADGRLIVGVSGGDEGVRGFVEAFDAQTGRLDWRFYTIPAPGHGWVPASGDHGGGAVWTTPSYDPATHTVYVGTGNPSPDYFGAVRPGANPYTDSVLAIDVRTGQLRFAVQEVSHDLWDYDVASPPLLFPDGSGHTVVGEAGKDGEWYEWNAETGQPVIQPVDFVKVFHRPPTAAGVMEWPGPNGGANYGPSAYDPIRQTAYVAGINGPEKVYAKPVPHSGRTADRGTGQSIPPAADWTGTITAIDVRTGQVRWQVSTHTPPIGGVTASAGGLVWYGTAGGWLTALSADTGAVVWRQQMGTPIGSAPIVYEWQGIPYVTVVTGGASSLTGLFPGSGPAQVVTYRLPHP
ncbi:MAG: PQQ-binding-like beta-propeller repeat protein [Alicyclobacillus sp.]|nr:PQQ-binding-like beta-propeller repeat protein [Alicyclobacillus sp.]